MNSLEIAKDYLREAKIRLKTAKKIKRTKHYAFSVRLSQESVELALKAALRLMGFDFPKWHDIGKVLIKEMDKFPKEFQCHVPNIAQISEFLAKKREPAMYGDEIVKQAPSY